MHSCGHRCGHFLFATVHRVWKVPTQVTAVANVWPSRSPQRYPHAAHRCAAYMHTSSTDSSTDLPGWMPRPQPVKPPGHACASGTRRPSGEQTRLTGSHEGAPYCSRSSQERSRTPCDNRVTERQPATASTGDADGLLHRGNPRHPCVLPGAGDCVGLGAGDGVGV
jgi:hypothetical protein